LSRHGAGIQAILRAAASLERLGARPDKAEVNPGSVNKLMDLGHSCSTADTLFGMRVSYVADDQPERVGGFTHEALGPLARDSWYIRHHGDSRRTWEAIVA